MASEAASGRQHRVDLGSGRGGRRCGRARGDRLAAPAPAPARRGGMTARAERGAAGRAVAAGAFAAVGRRFAVGMTAPGGSPMYAIVIDDGELHWRERAGPGARGPRPPRRVRAAGVNGADLAQRAGGYPAPPGWPPEIPGLEMAGEVAAVGARVTGSPPATGSWPGRRRRPGRARRGGRGARPRGARWAELARGRRLHRGFATAYDALFRQAGVTLGERVLVSGAAGGVGAAAVQLAARPARTSWRPSVTPPSATRSRRSAPRGSSRRRTSRPRPVRRRPRTGRRREPAVGARGPRDRAAAWSSSASAAARRWSWTCWR